VAPRLALTLACGASDLSRGLLDGSVAADGIDLTVLALPSAPRHWRMARHLEFDACELSLGTYLAMLDRGGCPVVAIPAFPHRRFRHRYLFVRSQSGIASPKELEGRRVGVRTWQTTTGIWVRGILQDDHGVDLRSIRWVSEHEEDVPLDLGPAWSLERVQAGRGLAAMLLEGELDAVVYPSAIGGADGVRPLFPEPRRVEEDYFRRTGIFPIMHTVVVTRELLEAAPWVARSLLDAWRRSTASARAALQDPRSVSLAWLADLVAEERALLGPEPWAHALEPARPALEALLRYAHEQGVTRRRWAVEELFFPPVLDEPPR
jgi:4,5-dihydroxyphthalate decarboxylase